MNLTPELQEALDAIEEVMVCDKGQSEEEWVEWCNKYLPLMKQFGRMTHTVEFV